MTSKTRRIILERLIESGFQVTPEALDYIMALESPTSIIDTLLFEKPAIKSRILSQDYLKSLLKQKPSESAHKAINAAEIETSKTRHGKSISSADIVSDEESKWSVKVLKNPNIDAVGSEGIVEDFLALFNDRFFRIKRIYMSRIDTRTALSLQAAIQMRTESKRRLVVVDRGMQIKRPPSQKIVGIIRSKSISRSQNVIIELEDSTGSIFCVIPAGQGGIKGHTLSEKANSLLLDEIICISGYIDQDGRMIADDIIFPDIPTAREIGRAKNDVYAAFISDIHYGSNEFLEDEFDLFIKSANGRDSTKSGDLWRKTKYLIIAGDLVDGIGVYPDQKDHLSISSVYDQYAELAEKLYQLPKHVKIICIPGNHDACRQALPRPAIPPEFSEPFYSLSNRIVMLGDPAHVVIEGVNILITHGDSLDDLVTSIPGSSYLEPAIPMRELLRKRHLAPLYGAKTELAPLHRDWMVIDTPPDIVHFGHAHHNAVSNYRGVQIINSGTFQGQTDFMRKQGIVPTPGIVTFINLRTGAPHLEFFYDFGEHNDFSS